MKHRIVNKTSLGSRQFNIQIELIPSNNKEALIIQKVESTSVSEEERQFIDNYLLFCLGDKYSVVNLNWQKGKIFEMKIFEN